MKAVSAFFGLCLFLGLTGCAGDADREFTQQMSRITPSEPPTFINSDVAKLFGNANFSARVEVQRGFAGTRPAMVGELSGREGSLFFIADEQRTKRGFAGGLSALWDRATQTAYLLNEPLQGYAPMRATIDTNAPSEIVEAGEENVGGERCRKTIINRRVGSEAVPALVVWRGVAEQDLPLRIQTTNTPAAATITLSRIRMQAPPAELFQLPNGFKRYESTDAMLSELTMRRSEAMASRSKIRRERFGNSGYNEDEEMPQKPMRQY